MEQVLREKVLMVVQQEVMQVMMVLVVVELHKLVETVDLEILLVV